jgi:adenylate cyclase
VAGGIDFEAEGFLEGLEGRARDERLDLLRWLAEDQGFGLDQLRRGHEQGLLIYLAAEREVDGQARHSLEEVRTRSDGDADLLVALRRAQGLPVAEPDVVALTDSDLESVEIARGYLDLGLDAEGLLGTSRVIGRALGQTAEAMRAVLLQAVLEPGHTERELAERYAEAVGRAMPLTRRMIHNALGAHLRNMVRTEAVDAEALASGKSSGARDVAVGFADLVGFTRMGEEVPPEELGAVADRLVVVANELVTAPERIVKTIGDAVMLVSPEAYDMVEAGLRIVEAIDDEGEAVPQVHVGVARGDALNRGGDWFGRPVNLASRVTAVARAGSLLATREVRDETREDFSWSAAGARRLKGLPEPVRLYRARRPQPAR